GGLIRAAEPAADAYIAASARRLPRQDGRQVACAETDQGIVRIQGRDHDLAHFAFGYGLPGARTDDLQHDVFIHHQAFASRRFVGDHAQVCRAIRLVAVNTALTEPLPERRRERLPGEHGPFQEVELDARLLRLLDDDA